MKAPPDPLCADSKNLVDLVSLDRDHPGFRDADYRRRRNEIAQIAEAHRPGEPIARIAYTPTEHAAWAVALEKLAPLHARYACADYLDLFPTLGFARDRIAQLADVNSVLGPATGFSLSPVAGLVSPRTFLTRLVEKRFLATQYMRHHSMPLYTPEPDVIHELVGHAPLLAHAEFAECNALFGEATRVADEATIEQLIRVYWYTLEFGVVDSKAGLKVVGAGLLSSFGELGGFESNSELRRFDLSEIAATPFNPTDYQSTLFVAEGARTLLSQLRAWLLSLIR